MTTCAIYVRQSIDKAEGISRQLARCRALAESRGWTVVAEFEDNAVSAFKSRGQGTAWQRLLDSPAEVVIAVNMDRLLRGQADLLALIDAGKTVATVEGDLDLTTAEGRFRAELLTSLASFEARRKGERQVRGNESRVANGLPVPGKRRFGFEPGNVIERPEEAEQVRQAYADILAGHSLRSIATRFGKPPVRVREILTNPSYAGWVVRKGQRFEAHATVARVVDRDVWEAVQDLLADDARRTSPGPGRKHFLSGIARCECGALMRAISVYYKCSADTAHATIYRRDLEPHVKSHLAAALIRNAGAATVGAPAPLARRLSELEDERTRWTRMGALPGVDFAEVERELVRIAREAEEVAERLGRSRVESATQRLTVEALTVLADALEDPNAVEQLPDGSTDVDLDLDAWETYFDALPLDSRRDLVDSRLTVVVSKGRGLGRVTVTPR
ncbi:recombinase family protein [Microbacterium sp. SMR1]|uniref:recombinase family protein n=1 Tax=Microbacterium sp. SMR1 TaxID=1497340 RepID=UPI000DCDD52F|nr:recombinase family protein [Microbacterium sp. SMR1]RAZ34837.1 hypothetical protein DO944_03165 [Microbacterium sp. SMR1]